MTTATNNLAAGKVEVGLSLKPGQAPGNLLIGQTVEAFAVGTGSGCGAAAGGGAGGRHGNGNAAGPGVPITTGIIASVFGSDRVQRFHRRGDPRGSWRRCGRTGLLRLGR